MSRTTESVVLIINPAAGRGRGATRGDAIARAFHDAGTRVSCVISEHPGNERRLAHEAAQRGASVVAIVGGDGTVHHAARGLLDAADAAAGEPAPALAIFSAGTGNDFVKSLGTPSHDIAAMVRRVETGLTRTVDVGAIDGIPFVNAAGFGFDVDVLERVQRGRERGSRLVGTAAYVITALRALGGFRGLEMAIGSAPMQRQLMVVFANGRCFGGTFHIAPEASLHDGLLHCIAIGDMPPLARLPLFLRAARGRHLSHAQVQQQLCRDTLLHFRAPPAFECDGERHQAASCEVRVTIRPQALRVVV